MTVTLSIQVTLGLKVSNEIRVQFQTDIVSVKDHIGLIQ